jgi:hypothetical protein
LDFAGKLNVLMIFSPKRAYLVSDCHSFFLSAPACRVNPVTQPSIAFNCRLVWVFTCGTSIEIEQATRKPNFKNRSKAMSTTNNKNDGQVARKSLKLIRVRVEDAARQTGAPRGVLISNYHPRGVLISNYHQRGVLISN